MVSQSYRVISTISTKGQIVLPKALRELDRVRPSDGFRITRLGPGRYLYERVETPRPQPARLIIDKEGLPRFRVPRHAPTISAEEVRRLEAELP